MGGQRASHAKSSRAEKRRQGRGVDCEAASPWAFGKELRSMHCHPRFTGSCTAAAHFCTGTVPLCQPFGEIPADPRIQVFLRYVGYPVYVRQKAAPYSL